MTLSLITGGAGFIGSNLADQLLAMGHKVTVVDNEYSDAHDQFYWNENTYNVNCDIRDYKALKNCMHGVDYVFHLAAQSYPKTSFESPIETLETNIVGTAKLLESLRTFKKDAIIHVCASSEVFGRVTKENIPIGEDVSFHPASPYAISKVGTDLLGRFYAPHEKRSGKVSPIL